MKKTFDFIGKFKYFLFASLAVMLIGLVVNIVFGTRMDVAFKGGTVIRYSYETAPDVAKVTSVAKEALGAEANVALDEINSTQVVSVTLPGKVTTEQKQTFADTLEKEFKDCKLVLFSSNTLSASMGSRFFLRCLFAVALAAVLLLVYVGLRFKRIGGFSAGLAALIALLHDLLIV